LVTPSIETGCAREEAILFVHDINNRQPAQSLSRLPVSHTMIRKKPVQDNKGISSLIIHIYKYITNEKRYQFRMFLNIE